MSLRVCVLSSSSKGNCTYIGTANEAVLIDAGLSAKMTLRLLAECQIEISTIRGICISHDHSDHHAGVATLHKRHGIPLYGNAGTIAYLSRREKYKTLDWNVFSTGSSFSVGNFEIEPFSVPHDAYEPVGFIVRAVGVNIGVAMDMGMVTNLVRERLKTCDCVVIEANHDPAMVDSANRPWALKQRILGRQGHLSNADAAALLADIALAGRLRHAFLGHLSLDCNHPDQALMQVRRDLTDRGITALSLSVCPHDRPSSLWMA